MRISLCILSLIHILRELLAKCPKEAVVYEQEFDPALGFFKDEPYTITRAEDGIRDTNS